MDRHLDFAAIQRLVRYKFVPRRIVDGRFTGRHASPQRGQSVEFRDYRQYFPGDEVGHIDWKVFARSDKLYVKRFEHETELVVHLLVDASRSMAYDEQGTTTKYDYACCLAAALGFVVMHEQDRVGFGLSRNGLADYQRPSSSIEQLMQMLEVMRQRKPRGVARMSNALSELTPNLRRGQVVIVFSDLWDETEELFQGVAKTTHLGAEVIIFHILHADEVNLPAWNQTLLRDSELGTTLQINVEEIRAEYVKKLARHRGQIERLCRQYGVQYHFASTQETHQATLERFLTQRCAQ